MHWEGMRHEHQARVLPLAVGGAKRLETFLKETSETAFFHSNKTQRITASVPQRIASWCMWSCPIDAWIMLFPLSMATRYRKWLVCIPHWNYAIDDVKPPPSAMIRVSSQFSRRLWWLLPRAHDRNRMLVIPQCRRSASFFVLWFVLGISVLRAELFRGSLGRAWSWADLLTWGREPQSTLVPKESRLYSPMRHLVSAMVLTHYWHSSDHRFAFWNSSLCLR
jgi:hypothetical protein